VGFGIGKGKTLDGIQAELGQVAEGVLNARSVRALSQRVEVEMPISDVVYRVLYEGISARQAVTELMTREKKSEI
jgi:glycerol-3-phosphate dehydrogenase (NAD(P)+)